MTRNGDVRGPKGAAEVATPAVTVSGLTYQYAGASQPAVDGMAFTVDHGEVFGFLGPSGAGKSTTQRVLLGLLRDFSGTARVLGRDVGDWRADDYAQIGVGFELPAHFGKLTARENLAFFAALYPAAHCRDTDELLAALDLTAAADRRVDAFSKGMAVRLNLARALLHQPDLLFLDEPTAGLDPVTARRVRALIRAERAAGRTVVLATHDMVTADELCDRVAFVVDGRVAALDSPTALKRRAGERRVRVGARTDGDATTHEFHLDGIGENHAFLALLRTGAVETIHTTEATLEDVFVAVTGKTLA